MRRAGRRPKPDDRGLSPSPSGDWPAGAGKARVRGVDDAVGERRVLQVGHLVGHPCSMGVRGEEGVDALNVDTLRFDYRGRRGQSFVELVLLGGGEAWVRLTTDLLMTGLPVHRLALFEQ